jgi:serine/tyrosine/threonine adenylyltransferase
LAETLLPLLSEDEEKAVAKGSEALEAFVGKFEAAYHAGLRRKLGLLTEREEDRKLAGDLLEAMAENQADFTLTFRRLSDAAAGPEGDEAVRNLFINPLAYDAWAARWRERSSLEPQDAGSRQAAMRAVNPAFIPRNHRVEAMIQAAVERNDFVPFEELLMVLSNSYEDQQAFAHYSEPPEPHQRVHRTFCGT